MPTKAELKAEITRLHQRIDSLLDDKPEQWEPEGGPYRVSVTGKVQHLGHSISTARQAGRECRTYEEAQALRKRIIARNRLDAWVREHADPGNTVIRWNEDTGEWDWEVPQCYAPGESTMDYESAARGADLLNRGIIKLEIDHDDT